MNMIEKVARASFRCWRDHMTFLGHHLDKGQTFEDMSDSQREFALMNAKAMIAAMREPTIEMRKACSFKIAEVVYPAMIDAALKE